MEDSLKKRYSIKLFANIITGIVGAILIAMVPKALGPIAYGQFVFLQDFFVKVIGFLDMGSSIAFFAKLSARNSRKELISFYFIYSFVILILVVTFIFVMDFLGYLPSLIPSILSEYIYLGLFFGFLAWFTQLFIKISDAYALTVSVEFIKVGHKIVSLLLLFIFVYQLSFDLKLFFYFNYITMISFLVVLTWLFVKKEIFQYLTFSIQDSRLLIKEFIDYCNPLVLYSLLGVIVGIFDIWLLQTVSGSEQMGFYGLSYSLATMCFFFTGAMTPIITREFSKFYEQKDLEQMRKLFYRYIPMLYSIAAYFAVFVSVQSENVLMVFTDEKFKDAYLVLLVLALYPIHQTYGQLSGSVFYATGQTKLMRNIALFTLPLGMVISSILIFLLDFGAVGLAYKMIIVQLIGVNIELYFNAKLLNLDMKYFLWHQIYSLIFFVVLAKFASACIALDSSFLEFMISGFLYTVFVIISTYIFPEVFATNKEEIKEFFLRLKNVIKI